MQDQDQEPGQATRCPARYRKRTIHMPAERSRQIALVAADRGVTSEAVIQQSISLGLLVLADQPDHCPRCRKRSQVSLPDIGNTDISQNRRA
jgi:hypothetical protein